MNDCRIWLRDIEGINEKAGKLQKREVEDERVRDTRGAWESASESATVRRSGAWEKYTERMQACEVACDAILILGLFRSTPFDLSYQDWSILI